MLIQRINAGDLFNMCPVIRSLTLCEYKGVHDLDTIVPELAAARTDLAGQQWNMLWFAITPERHA